MSRRTLIVVVLAAAVVLLSSCSPLYIVRAGWEEARILMRREPIDELLAREDTDQNLKQKLQLVLDARAYSKSVGLVPKGSFTQYSKIDRDVLVWVLSGSSKIALRPVTWWFPIVGNIPYKGFFDKADADKTADALEKRNLDVFLRPSAAFSTLGWFDDPLLSTTVKFDEVALANTVIHEILHNTIWVKDQAPFNETLANFVGSMGAVEFFSARSGAQSAQAQAAAQRWQDELDFARFLEATIKELQPIYQQADEKLLESEGSSDKEKFSRLVQARDQVLARAVERWTEQHPAAGPRKNSPKLNNATIIAHQIYLTQPWVFVDLFEQCGSSVSAFVDQMKVIAERLEKEKGDPYAAVCKRTAELQEAAKTTEKPQ
jgi:predicted aminopeptidase